MMLVLRPDFGVTEEKKIAELVKKTVGDEVSVKDLKIIGKKTLAYPIKKLNEGIYVLVNLSAEKFNVAQIQKQMNLGNDILRFLVTAKEE